MDIQAAMTMEKLRTPVRKKEPDKVNKLSATKLAELTIKASYERSKWLKDHVTSKEFYLVTIPLDKVAIPPGRIEIQASSTTDRPIVVDINKNRIGGMNGYTPGTIVIAGADRHKVARMNGKTTILAWVGAEAAKLLRISADSQFGSNELQDKLNECLREKYAPEVKKQKKTGDSPTAYPWIREIYPYENYFVYQYEGVLYKQSFKCDLKSRTCTLIGDPEKVVQKYVDIGAKATEIEKAAILAPRANTPVFHSGGMISNGTSPGSGVGPRINVKPNPKSEIARKF